MSLIPKSTNASPVHQPLFPIINSNNLQHTNPKLDKQEAERLIKISKILQEEQNGSLPGHSFSKILKIEYESAKQVSRKPNVPKCSIM